MVAKPALPRWSIWLLGAINGLLVGLFVEQVKITYLNYEMGRIARLYAQSDWSVDFVEARRDAIIPLICIITFAAVSYFIQRYFISRPRAVLLSWFVMGVVALLTGYFMSSFGPNVFSLVWILTIAVVSYLVHQSWKNRLNSILLTWLVIGISAFFVLAFGVEIVGILFYWPELRKSFTWLVCFGIVLVINSIYGAVIKFIFRRDRFTGEVESLGIEPGN